jgi:triose/dihydroxyacetone kinase / FAD-AMP lyase (cyclizing)
MLTAARARALSLAASKHFLATPGPLVASALSALTHTNPSLVLDAANKIVYHLPTPQGGKVAVVSGGGSGHEPSFSALVGRGLLSAGVAGTIFASPGAEQVRRCVTRLGRESKDQKGVLVVVMNYTVSVRGPRCVAWPREGGAPPRMKERRRGEVLRGMDQC